ncbi:MAG: class I SAM-dependent methyltransferase [Bacilli bacterium]|jgi:SAM-dependent methyltransferase|nr:class I SAM-dependent methyltransferase [Bacilli bacterium]
MENKYHTFAYYYNQLIPLDFYEGYVKKIEELGVFYHILDLGCGSGTLCQLLKKDDNEVTGIDLSEEMLMIGQDYNRINHLGIEYIKQDLNELNLVNHHYDLITSTLDTLNYLNSIDGLKHVFKEVANALSKDGYFIFDLLTKHYFEKIVYDYYQSEDLKDFSYEWYVKLINENMIKHELIIEANNNVYQEEHYQYLYEFELINELLNSYDLKIEKIAKDYNELDDSLPSRLYYYVRRI